MPEPKTLGRVDWMPRLKVWRVIWYKGAADVPAGDYPTKKEAEDALRKLVARGNPTPEVTEKRIPRDIIIRKEVEPLYPSGYKYVAYEADGTPLYIGEETAKAAEARVRTQMPVKSIRVSEVAIPKAPAPEVTARLAPLAKYADRKDMYITGSFATGKATAKSDLDIIVQVSDDIFNEPMQFRMKDIEDEIWKVSPEADVFFSNPSRDKILSIPAFTKPGGLAEKELVKNLWSNAKPISEVVKAAIPKASGNPGVTPEVTKPVIFGTLEDRLIEVLPILKRPSQTGNWEIALADLPQDIQENLLFGRWKDKLSLQGQRLLAPIKLKNGMTIRISESGKQAGLLPKLLIDEPEVAIPKAPVTPEVTGYKRVLYRGIGAKPSDEGMYGKGTYFSSSKEYAAGYGKVVTSEITLQKPFQPRTIGDLEDIGNPIFKEARQKGLSYEDALEAKSQGIRNYLEKQGYDGIVLPETRLGYQEVIVFHPEKAAVAIPKAPVTPEVTREFVIETHSPMGQPYKTIVQFTPTENTEANRVMQEIKDKFTKFNNEQQSEAKAVLTQLHGEKRPYMGFYEKNMQELNLINDYMDRISSGKFDIHQLLRDAENVKLAIPKAEAGNPGVTPEIKIEERALLYHLATANQKESVESYLRKRFGDEILDKLHKERLIGREPKGLYYITLRGREVAGKIPPKGANLYAEAKKILEEGLEVKSPAPPKASGNPGSTAKEAKSVERLGKGETLNNLLPMPPTDGPPLPRMLDLKWPWKK